MSINILHQVAQTKIINYFALSWEMNDSQKILLRLNTLIKSHYHDFIGTPRLIISAILLMLFNYDYIHRKIEGKIDISNSKQGKAYIITILMAENKLFHSTYLNYLKWPIHILGLVFFKIYTDNTLIKIKNKFIKLKENERIKNNNLVILDTWKIEMRPIIFFKLMSHKRTSSNNKDQQLQLQKQKLLNKYTFVDLPSEIIHIISGYSVGCITGIQYYLS